VLTFLAVKLLFELKLNLADINARVENNRLVGLQHIVKLLETGIAAEGFGLNLILVCLFIKRKTVAGDGSINCATEVGVLLDDITLGALDLDVFPGLVHFTEDLDTFALNFSDGTLLVFSLFQTNFFSALGMAFLGELFTLNKGRLQQVKALVLETLDIILALVPLTELEFFHETATEDEAGLIRGGGKSVFEGSFFTHLFNEVHLLHASGETCSKLEVADDHSLGHIVLVEGVRGTVRVSLSFTFSEHSLYLGGLSGGLRLRLLG